MAEAQSLRDAIQNNDVILCAHRGGMYADYAENSLLTLEYLAKKFNGRPVMAEVDVRKSKDGTLFLLHDATLERTTNGTGNIEERDDKYLRTLKLKTSDGRLTDEKLPTLDDLLKFLNAGGKGKKRNNIYLMLDVKIDDWKAVLDMVRKKQSTAKCLVLTFKPGNSKIVHQLDPFILVSCLVRNMSDFEEITPLVPNNMLAYVGRSTPPDVIAKMKSMNIPMVTDASEVTTNNSSVYDKAFYSDLIQQGVRVFVTDLPVEVAQQLQ
jgi:glycerophosphoryl diester phosphodiesterase